MPNRKHKNRRLQAKAKRLQEVLQAELEQFMVHLMYVPAMDDIDPATHPEMAIQSLHDYVREYWPDMPHPWMKYTLNRAIQRIWDGSEYNDNFIVESE